MEEGVYMRIDWLTNFLIANAKLGRVYIQKEVMDELYKRYGLKVSGKGRPEGEEDE